MKIIKKNLKKQELTVKIENFDDLWIISQLISTNDLIKGKTERKIKIGENTDRNPKVVRKQFFLAIKVEKTELLEAGLKVLGIIVDSPDEIPRGEHHSFNLELNSIITIVKEQWFKYQLEKITDATKSTPQKILLVIFDREEALFAKLKGKGFELIGKIKGNVQKKEKKHVSKNDFNIELSKKILEYEKKFNHIILASPGFWKENLMKILPESIKKKIVQASISQASESAINEVLKRPELQKVLDKNRIAKETKLLDKLLLNISKGTACYGLKEVEEKTSIGAVRDIIISYSFLQKSKNNNYEKIEKVLLTCEQMDGKVHVINSENVEKTLNSLTGIAGILRWKNQ